VRAVRVEAGREAQGFVEGARVVEQALPEGLQGEGHFGIARVGTPQLDVLLEARVGEERGEVFRPVAEGGAQVVRAARGEVAEGQARHVVVIEVAASGEEHRDVERVGDERLRREVVRERGRREARAVGVGVEPRGHAGRLVAGRPAFGEGRVGEHRRDDGREAVADREFFSEVFPAIVVEVDLHGAGARHHVPRARAAACEVRAHHLVTPLREPLLLGERAEGIEAAREEAPPFGVRHLAEPREPATQAARVLFE
jgi:hypothetical protein